MPFTVFQAVEGFSIENFIKTEINGNLKVQVLLNTMNESELPSQAVTVLPGHQR